MTIMAVFADEKEPELQVVFDRNYETHEVTVKVRNYDAETWVAVPIDQLRRMAQMIGL